MWLTSFYFIIFSLTEKHFFHARFSQPTKDSAKREKDELLRPKITKNEVREIGHKDTTRQVSSMIHSAKPTVSPVVNIVFSLFCFARFWKMGTDVDLLRTYGQHVRKQWSLYWPWLWVGRVDQYKKVSVLMIVSVRPTSRLAPRTNCLVGHFEFVRLVLSVMLYCITISHLHAIEMSLPFHLKVDVSLSIGMKVYRTKRKSFEIIVRISRKKNGSRWAHLISSFLKLYLMRF